MDITLAPERPDDLVDRLTALWRASVEATHDFLTPDEVDRIAAFMPDALRAVASLAVACDADGQPLGFAGAEAGKLEMLFVAPEARGRGVGSALLAHGVAHLGVRLVDVNEQNPAARGFYEHHGFRPIGRSDVDDQGAPYPIVHLALAPKTQAPDRDTAGEDAPLPDEGRRP